MYRLRHAPRATAEPCIADRQAAGGKAEPSLHCSPLGLSALPSLGLLMEGLLCVSPFILISPWVTPGHTNRCRISQQLGGKINFIHWITVSIMLCLLMLWISLDAEAGKSRLTRLDYWFTERERIPKVNVNELRLTFTKATQHTCHT